MESECMEFLIANHNCLIFSEKCVVIVVFLDWKECSLFQRAFLLRLKITLFFEKAESFVSNLSNLRQSIGERNL